MTMWYTGNSWHLLKHVHMLLSLLRGMYHMCNPYNLKPRHSQRCGVWGCVGCGLGFPAHVRIGGIRITDILLSCCFDERLHAWLHMWGLCRNIYVSTIVSAWVIISAREGYHDMGVFNGLYIHGDPSTNRITSKIESTSLSSCYIWKYLWRIRILYWYWARIGGSVVLCLLFRNFCQKCMALMLWNLKEIRQWHRTVVSRPMRYGLYNSPYNLKTTGMV